MRSTVAWWRVRTLTDERPGTASCDGVGGRLGGRADGAAGAADPAAAAPEHRGPAAGVERGRQQAGEDAGVLEELAELGLLLVGDRSSPRTGCPARVVGTSDAASASDAARGKPAERQQRAGAHLHAGVDLHQGQRIGRQTDRLGDRHADLLGGRLQRPGVAQHLVAHDDERRGEQGTDEGTRADHAA